MGELTCEQLLLNAADQLRSIERRAAEHVQECELQLRPGVNRDVRFPEEHVAGQAVRSKRVNAPMEDMQAARCGRFVEQPADGGTIVEALGGAAPEFEQEVRVFRTAGARHSRTSATEPPRADGELAPSVVSHSETGPTTTTSRRPPAAEGPGRRRAVPHND